jgi:hypothetical protein
VNNSDEFTTWDGEAVASEPPHGASIIVYRKAGRGYEFLLVLHHGQDGPEFSGDWALTPPSWARYSGESIEDRPKRELRGETGLSLPMKRTDLGSAEWVIYMAECSPSDRVHLSGDRDRSVWLPAPQAIARCQPKMVGDSIEAAARELGVLESDLPKQ